MLIGRIAEDLEIRMTQSGKKVLSFSLAVNREMKDQSGKYPVDFIRCTAWEKAAEYLGNYAQKGMRIGISGRLEINEYTNKHGNNVREANVVIEHGEICERRKEDEKKQNEPVQEIRIEHGYAGAEITGNEDLEFY